MSTTQILRELPEEFTTFYLHVRSLDFEEKPQYKVLRRLLWQVSLRRAGPSVRLSPPAGMVALLTAEGSPPLLFGRAGVGGNGESGREVPQEG